MILLKGNIIKAVILALIIGLNLLVLYSIWLVDSLHAREQNTAMVGQQNAGLGFLDQPKLVNRRDLFALVMVAPTFNKPVIEPDEPTQQAIVSDIPDNTEPVKIEVLGADVLNAEVVVEANPVAEYTYVGYLQKGDNLDAFLMQGASSLVVRSGDWLSPKLLVQSITDQTVVINVKPSGIIYKLVINEENI